MATTTALELNKQIHQQLGDYIGVPTTTNIGANQTILSTNLNQYDGGRDGCFTDWWVYITDKNNAGVDRKIRNYYTANGGAVVYGAALALDATQANVRVHRYSYTDVQTSLNDAIREIYPTLHRDVDDRSALTTNYYFYEYALSSELANGNLQQVQINVGGSSAIGDDNWSTIYGWSTVNGGSHLRLPDLYTTGYKLRLLGTAPLETVSTATDVVNISGEKVNLLIAYAKYKFFQAIEGYVASEDTTRYANQSAKAYAEFMRLKPRLGMVPAPSTMNLRTY